MLAFTHALTTHTQCVSTPKHRHTHIHTLTRGDSKTVQCGSVAVTAWLDRKLVKAMSSAHDPTESTTVLRRQRDGIRVPVKCPVMIRDYNNKMGGVDNGDQSRGYYKLRSKFRKFYMYIFNFLVDVAITNSYILYRQFADSHQLKTVKEFRLKLASQLISSYSSRKLPGRRSFTVRPLPLTHFPTKNQEGKRGKCKNCKPKRTDTPWFCATCKEWLCHTGNPEDDCYLAWHKSIL